MDKKKNGTSVPTRFGADPKKPFHFSVVFVGCKQLDISGFLPCSCCDGCPKDKFAASGVVISFFDIRERGQGGDLTWHTFFC